MAAWMTQTIHVASKTGVDSYGRPSYETPRAVKARVELRRRMVRNSSGEESVSSHVVYSLEPILLTDRVWLPGLNSATAEGSKLPLQVDASSDKPGARTLYRVDL
jgi:hypothetical protein